MMNKLRLLSCAFLTVVSSLAGAAVSPNYANSNSWTTTVSAYLWALNMHGNVKTEGQTTNINENFGDILSQFHSGGMLWLDFQRKRFGIFFNGLYSVLDDKQTVDGAKIKTTSTFALVSAGVSYNVLNIPIKNQNNRFLITPYVGFRYTSNSVDLKVEGLKLSQNEDWTVPIIGSRFTYQFNPHWSAELAADFGALNLRTNYSTNVIGLLAYHQLFGWKNTTAYLGYRWLYQNYQTGSGLNEFQWKMNLFGPVVGVSVSF